MKSTGGFAQPDVSPCIKLWLGTSEQGKYGSGLECFPVSGITMFVSPTHAPRRVTWSGGSISRCFDSQTNAYSIFLPSLNGDLLPFQNEAAAAKKAAASGQQSGGTPKTKEGEMILLILSILVQSMLTYFVARSKLPSCLTVTAILCLPCPWDLTSAKRGQTRPCLRRSLIVYQKTSLPDQI